jgi:hypothetical protein
MSEDADRHRRTLDEHYENLENQEIPAEADFSG